MSNSSWFDPRTKALGAIWLGIAAFGFVAKQGGSVPEFHSLSLWEAMFWMLATEPTFTFVGFVLSYFFTQMFVFDDTVRRDQI